MFKTWTGTGLNECVNMADLSWCIENVVITKQDRLIKHLLEVDVDVEYEFSNTFILNLKNIISQTIQSSQ
jgi:hypothetical protein